MKHYYFGNIPDKKGSYIVHSEYCDHLPRFKTYIGYFSDCHEAIVKAKTQHPFKKFDGCSWCYKNFHN